MGNLIITDTDFSFEWNSTENSTPPGSADIADQDVLFNLQHYNEDFFFTLEPVNEKFFYIYVQTKTKKGLDNAEITITDLDDPTIPPQTLTTDAWGFVVFNATILSRYNVAVKKSGYRPFSFELGMLSSQPPATSIRTSMQDFKSIITTKEEKRAVEESG